MRSVRYDLTHKTKFDDIFLRKSFDHSRAVYGASISLEPSFSRSRSPNCPIFPFWILHRMIYVACRRRQRDFLENNTRVPRKNQKPARTTHSPESLIEFHQSTTDEEKEVPMSTTSTAPSGSSKLRKKLFDLLGDNALYTRLKDDEKRPRSSFKEGKRNR